MNTVCKLLPFAFAVSAFADNTFFFNEAGYDQGQPISIVVQSTEELEGTEWTLFYAPDGGTTGATVKSGTFKKGENPDNWARSGKFYLSLTAGSPSTSAEFTVDDKALAKNTLGKVLNYFYNDRADKAPINEWDQKVPVYGKDNVTRDVHGRWRQRHF